MEVREHINPEDSMNTIIDKMTEGNPGAAVVLGALAKKAKDASDVLFPIFDMDDMNIRGSQIWIGFKVCCEHNLDVFVEKLEHRDQGLVDEVNKFGLMGNHVWKAVVRGAANGDKPKLEG